MNAKHYICHAFSEVFCLSQPRPYVETVSAHTPILNKFVLFNVIRFVKLKYNILCSYIYTCKNCNDACMQECN